MATTPQPYPTIILDDLATIAAQIQPLIQSANLGDTQATRRIEEVFASYGIVFTDTPAVPDREAPCH
ncbi:hypothetical protein [Actinoplanes sp. NBRC 103695]|uniref:hypothetical protein n=1 Tax=Actinoplanes sp. NBRC 103695 TaxID=3032202 RepID=UPI0024A4E535|nr:hypothetical protein [Actinoplanes sp. NBRC 103695]GLZ00818.1 hypothetical protein Acsp02_80700 [Actinoplanes sp. NBRC 103695]